MVNKLSILMEVLFFLALYRSTGGNSLYLNFLFDICRCLVASVDTTIESDYDVQPDELPLVVATSRSLRACDVPPKIRYDKINHWSMQMTTQRCKYPGCKKRTTFKCSKCCVYLCVNGSDCYLQFHNALQRVLAI